MDHPIFTRDPSYFRPASDPQAVPPAIWRSGEIPRETRTILGKNRQKGVSFPF
jgi:hypothetical protein